jgi:hypothetical protein
VTARRKAIVSNNFAANTDFRRQRGAGIVYIAIGAIVAVAIWYAINTYAPPVPGMDTLAARMLFTLKCYGAAVLFTLVLGVEAVAHERLVTPAFDPLAGFETRRMRVNQRYLQNTLEQTVVFGAALFGLAAWCPTDTAMRAVEAATAVWVLARWAFWIGYHISAAGRGLGAAGMALAMILLIYDTSRFGGELYGPPGAWAPVILFVLIEAFLFWATRASAEGA